LTPVTVELTLQLLAWLADHPRTYAETMEAWRTSCPRLSVWEDALIDGLVSVKHGDARGQPMVLLTRRGQVLLDKRSPSSSLDRLES